MITHIYSSNAMPFNQPTSTSSESQLNSTRLWGASEQARGVDGENNSPKKRAASDIIAA